MNSSGRKTTGFWGALLKCFMNGSDEKDAKKLFLKGLHLANRQGKFGEAIALYDELVRRFDPIDSPGVREHVAFALIHKGMYLGRQGKTAEALFLYDDIVKRFANDDTPQAREKIAITLLNKGNTLEQQGKDEEAIAVYDEIVQRFGNDAPRVRGWIAQFVLEFPGARGWAAVALHYKGGMLQKQGKVEEAIATFDDLIRRFGKDKSSGMMRRTVALVKMTRKDISTRQKPRPEN